MIWQPKPGDRIKTIITKDSSNEVVYLNADHVIDSVITAEFLIFTSEFLPWPHQIIDYLSNERNCNRNLVLRALVEFDRLHSELDFDALCTLFLKEQEIKMRLSEGLLCANCDEIYSSQEQVVNAICPSCTSPHYLTLNKILNRNIEEEKNSPCE